MIRISRWKLVMLFIYSCSTIPAIMYLLTLFFLWQPSSKEGGEFFSEEHLHISLNMAGVGFLLGFFLWLSYYFLYRRINKIF